MAKEIHTDDSQEYQFHEASTTTLRFKVKAAHDAHVCLSSSDDQEATPVYEIFIGGWENAKCAVRRDRTKPDRAEAETPDVLSDDEARGFWVTWDSEGKVEVGRDGESDAFLSYSDPEPFTITHYGLRTAWGASGDWEIEGVGRLSTPINPGDTKYTMWPTCSGSINFSVRTGHDAHLALTSGARQTDRMYEIFIGGWNNAKSAIRKNKSKPDVAQADTPNILDAGEYRRFQLSWQNNTITLTNATSGFTILQWQDTEPLPITHVGIRTAWGSSGDWKLRDGEVNVAVQQSPAMIVKKDDEEDAGEPVWIAAAGGEVPEGAVCGGTDHDCEILVARAMHEGALLPGKFVPSHGAAYVSWDGGEHRKEDYEVLCGCKPKWVQVNQGDEIPTNALPGGRTIDGETLFIGRVPHEGTVTVGKVHPSHATCYIPYGGEEVGFPEYEVLVRQ